jgi:hypothetical protein
MLRNTDYGKTENELNGSMTMLLEILIVEILHGKNISRSQTLEIILKKELTSPNLRDSI